MRARSFLLFFFLLAIGRNVEQSISMNILNDNMNVYVIRSNEMMSSIALCMHTITVTIRIFTQFDSDWRKVKTDELSRIKCKITEFNDADACMMWAWIMFYFFLFSSLLISIGKCSFEAKQILIYFAEFYVVTFKSLLRNCMFNAFFILFTSLQTLLKCLHIALWLL